MTRSADDLQAALRHEGALRRLAAALGTRGFDADDAAQHALTQEALGRRPRGAPLLPFLRATLRNHVRNVQRLGARRRQHEANAHVPADGEPAHAWWAREQLRREVANSVLALPEPYRTAVWLRWFEDLDVAAVAARTGVPAATVRTRLARAHARLRERLDAAYGERDWALLALPLAPHAAGACALAIPGGLLVNKMLAVGALLVLTALVWWWQERAAPVPAPSANAPAAAPSQAPDAGTHAPSPERTAVEPPAPAPAAVPTAPVAPVADPTAAQLEAVAGLADAGCLEGVVLDGRGPLAGGTAWLRSLQAGGLPWGTADDWDAAPGVLRAAVDAQGRFRFCGLATEGYALGVRTAEGAVRHVYVDLPAGESRAARVRFPFGGASLRGVVRDPDAQLAAGWHVAVFNLGPWLGGTQTIVAATTDARGEFAVAGLCAGTYRIDASPIADFRDARKQSLTVEVAAGAVARVQLGPAPDSCDWTGRVLLPGGTALAALMKTDLQIALARGTAELAIAPDGSFRGRVDTGTHTFAVVFATGVRVPLGSVEVPAGPWTHDLVLPDGVLRVRATFVAAASPQWPRTAWQTRVTFAAGGSAPGVRGADGCDYYFGVPAGAHRIVAWPHTIAGAPPVGSTFTMLAQREQDIDLVLQER
jgi:RNA polymerase sigma-70 factor (ECF subfamily)